MFSIILNFEYSYLLKLLSILCAQSRLISELTSLLLQCESLTKSEAPQNGPESVILHFEHTFEHPLCSNEWVELRNCFFKIRDLKLAQVRKT